MKLFENDSVVISLDESVPCLEWIGKDVFAPPVEFRQTEEKSLELYIKKSKKYSNLQWFVDARLFKAVTTEDMLWVTEHILPKLADAGLKREAFIVPKSIIGKMNVDNYKSKAGKSVEIQLFDDVSTAKEWLKD